MGTFPENWRWRDEIHDPGDCAIFDVDGVLADANGRQHFLDWPHRDWDGFFAAAIHDKLIADSAELLTLLKQTLQIVLLTARPELISAQTVDWLNKHAVPYDLLVMRPDFNRQPSAHFKRSMLEDLRRAGFVPRIAFEDDIRNVEMFQSHGVHCVYIHSGYYD